MSNFNFYKADKVYKELFLQFPKVFLYSDKYRDLSDSAKIAYMVFKDRFNYSLENNWVDEDNNVFFVYTNNELERLFNCSEHKVIKIKKELENKGLLLQVKQGFDPKEKRNKPNRLYIADLNVESHEVYDFQKVLQKQSETQSEQGTAKSAVRQKQSETQSEQGTAKSAVRQKQSETQSEQGTAKSAVNQYKELKNKDNKDNKDQAVSYREQAELLSSGVASSKSDKTVENDLINNYIENNSLEDLYGKQLIDNLKKFSFNNFERFKLFHEKLYYANDSAEKELGYSISVYENSHPNAQNYREDLNRTFWKCIQAEKSGKVDDLNKYMFSSFKNTFLFIGKDINKLEKNLPEISTHDWVNQD